jgi:hypothetical protein
MGGNTINICNGRQKDRKIKRGDEMRVRGLVYCSKSFQYDERKSWSPYLQYNVLYCTYNGE